MPINPSNYTDATINASNFTGDRANEHQTVGSPIGLLLAITQAESVDSPTFDFANDYTDTSINASNWGNDAVFTQGLVTEAGAGIVLESGIGLLIP